MIVVGDAQPSHEVDLGLRDWGALLRRARRVDAPGTGSQPNFFQATTPPITAQIITTPKWPHSNDGESLNGLKASPNARAKCLSGKMLPRVSSHPGTSRELPKLMNTCDTNASGRMVELAMPGAAEADLATAARATPSRAKQIVPATNARIAAGIFAASMLTS